MTSLIPIFSFVFGIVVGGIGAWFLSKNSRAYIQINEELLKVQERFKHSEQQRSDLQIALEGSRHLTETIRIELSEQMKKCAAAETINDRIPELEKKLTERESQMNALLEEQSKLKSQLAEQQARLEEERKAYEEKLVFLDRAQVKLTDAFSALSAEALKANNTSFLDLARENLKKYQAVAQGDLELRQKSIDQLVKPLQESLETVNKRIQEVEKDRTIAYTSLTEQVKHMARTQSRLEQETSNLVKALRSPITRGRWGEIQLQRVVEMAGMLEYCDFFQQESVDTEAGRLRPDMIIKLPSNKTIVVDSKVSLEAYLAALEAPDETEKTRLMKDHARQIRDHIARLSEKNYWSQFEASPEFVVLFLPGEPFFSAALEQDPALIEKGVEKQIIIATPTTLIALLKAVAYGWRQERLAENAQKISDLGKELYQRIQTLAQHFQSLGRNLEGAVSSYNNVIGNLESRVLVSSRRFKELGIAQEKEIPELSPVTQSLRSLDAPELKVQPGQEFEQITESDL